MDRGLHLHGEGTPKYAHGDRTLAVLTADVPDPKLNERVTINRGDLEGCEYSSRGCSNQPAHPSWLSWSSPIGQRLICRCGRGLPLFANKQLMSARGLAVELLNVILYKGPQYSGDFVANWNVSVGAPNYSFNR